MTDAARLIEIVDGLDPAIADRLRAGDIAAWGLAAGKLRTRWGQDCCLADQCSARMHEGLRAAGVTGAEWDAIWSAADGDRELAARLCDPANKATREALGLPRTLYTETEAARLERVEQLRRIEAEFKARHGRTMNLAELREAHRSLNSREPAEPAHALAAE